jgi:chromate transporter
MTPSARPYSLGDLVRYFLRLGALGFGGPIALAGYMQRDLVEDRKWISKEDYLEGLALAQLAPGPLAAQLAIYIGWLRARVWGATVVGFAFVAPSFVMVLALSAFYVRFGGLPWMRGVFYGIGAAVIAIIARSVWKLVRLSMGRDWLPWAIVVVNALVTAWTEREIVWVVLASGVVALSLRGGAIQPTVAAVAPLALFSTGLSGPASARTLWTIGAFFAQAGAFVFGSGLAIVPFLHGGVVGGSHWLDERQFLDAVAVAMITPGPVVITVAFIGYLVAGPLGAAVAAVGVFFPCWLFVILPAPYFRKLSGNRRIKAFVDGVTAAATGAIAGAAVVLGRRAIVDLATIGLFLATLVVLVKVKKAPEPLVIVAAGLVGLLVAGCGRHREAPRTASPPAAPSFHADVLPVLVRDCATAHECHGDQPTDSVALDLRAPAAWAELVGHPSKARPSAMRVSPGDAAASFLVDKLTGNLGLQEGKAMPIDPEIGEPIVPSPLVPRFVDDVLRPWIAAGARND